MLTGFRLVYVESLRHDLSPTHREHVVEVLNELATNCVNQGMGREIAVIVEDVKTEQKLVALKNAFADGAFGE